MSTEKDNEFAAIRKEQISNALGPFGITLTEDQLAKVQAYVPLLLKWNRLTSLTSMTDPDEIVARHFGESIYAASLLPMQSGRLVDIGTGAGFPGLALKIACPGLHVTLVESNQRKCAFLAEVVRTLNLSNISILPTRYEELRPKGDLANFVTARAVGGFPNLLRWSRTALASRGHLVLWVGGEDLTAITNSKGWIWNPATRLPESQRRYVLVGRCGEA